MLTISSPIANPEGYSTAGIVASPIPVPNFAPLAVATALTPLPLLPPAVIIPAAPPPIVNGVVSVPSPVARIPTTLTIEGITYTFTLAMPPPIGSFTIDGGGMIKIGLRSLVPPKAIAYYSIPDTIPTDFVPAPYPEICSQFPLTGELSWTLTWEEQPTASLEFITDAKQRDDVINYFTTVRSIYIYGVVFCPSGQLQITEISLTKSAIPLIKVSVSMTGFNAHLLDRYTSIGINFTLPDCTAPPEFDNNSPTAMTVADLAIRLGTSVTGAPIQIDRSVLTSPAVPITLGSLLDTNSIRGVGAFIDYHRAGIVLIPYGNAASHDVTVRSDVSTSLNAKIGSAPYFKTYDPRTLVTFGSNPNRPATAIPAPDWQPRPQVTTTTFDGDPNANINPYGGTQRDLSIVFDISGKRKRSKKTTLVNGQPSREVETEYGYVAVGRDDIGFTGGAQPTIDRINGSWQPIESNTTDYQYNGDGYLVAVFSRGFKLTRYRTENAQKPESLAVRISGDTPDPLEVANLQTFRFFKVYTSRTERLTLAAMSDYYDDIKPTMTDRTICLPDGSQVTIPVRDEAYIAPYFVAVKRVVEDSFASTPDPKSTALKPLPNLTTGQKVDFIERTTVRPRPPLSLSITTSPPNPTEYTRSTDNYAASDGQFTNMLSIAESSIVSGRPPIAPNTGAILELIPLVPPTPTTPPVPTVPFAVKSGLAPDSVTGVVTVGSLNYPTAATETAALAAAKIDIDIINCKNSNLTALTTDFRPQIRPGDRVSYRVNGATRTGRVIFTICTLQINGLVDGMPHITSTGTQLKLGADLKTPVISVKLPTRSSTLRI